MINLLRLTRNECRMQLYEMKQYWLETVLGLAFLTIMFLALFFGIQFFLPNEDNPVSLDGLVLGYVMFSFCSSAYSAAPEALGGYSQKGFLEQLYMCPSGFSLLLIAKVLATLLIAIVSTILLAYVAMLLSGNWIDLNFLLLIPLLFLAAPAIIGVGLVIAGLTLVYKRLGLLGSITMLGIIALVSLPGLPVGPVSLLPLSAGASLIRMSVLEQQPIEYMNLLIVGLNSALYLWMGLVAFKKFENLAKRRNLIGQY